MLKFRNEEDLCEYFTKRKKEIPPRLCGNFYSAIIGTTKGRLIYDYEKMIDELMTEDVCSFDDAVDYIEYNAMGVLINLGDKRPIIRGR